MTLISNFIFRVQEVHATGNATEHSYRSAFEALFSDLGVTALNEPKRVQCGAPDFIVSRGDIVVGHVEAKDPHTSIQSMKGSNKSQQDRYRAALPNLIYTNGLDWDFFRDGDLTASVTVADIQKGVIPKPDQYDSLENLLRDFIAQRPQTITSPRDLAERMAGKANLIKDVLRNTLKDNGSPQSELADQYEAFRENLIHDITPEDFADIYAETIAYGMFAARLHDSELDSFSRREALDLLPKSNPFLRSLFTYVAGYGLDDRIAWIIDDLACVFQACDVAKLMEGFGKLTGQQDPFLHFYETFLAAYNPKKRKARGVWYTPEPVVSFIVRAVDEVLQKEFGLPDGLADTSKVTIDWDTGQRARTRKGEFRKDGKNVIEKRDVHRVQILDPATGTGTFLATVVKQIAPKVKEVAPGMWGQYIEKDLIPRLHGFELLMASYAMCHMKLDMILTELGYTPHKDPPRLSVYLTNSLEEGEPANQMLQFTQWLSREAKGANTIKRDMPIMCVIGNPPYLGESGVSEGWMGSLMDDYKKEPGGKVKLKERNPKWINDLYVKFIRLASHLIERNGEGILGFVTNHGYLDNPTFRGMRWHLMQSFDKLYVLDLHGNTKKKETAPDGSMDANVFDIMQGVAILIGVKRRKASKPKPPAMAEVFHAHLWGTRREKYRHLQKANLNGTSWTKLDPDPKYLMFYPIDRKLLETYDAGFNLAKFMPLNQIGFQSHRDRFAVAFDRTDIERRLKDMMDNRLTDDDLRRLYGLCDNRDWKVAAARSRAKKDQTLRERIVPCDYRPFDRRFCLLHEAAMDYPRWPLLKNGLINGSFGLNFLRQTKSATWQHGLVSKFPTPAVFVEIKDGSNFAPFYIQEEIDQTYRVNFDRKIYKRLKELASHSVHGAPDEVAVFDYIYGVLYCPIYRETYAEFLKIDFPRIPWPSSPEEFWDISVKGTALRNLHLMDHAAVGETPYPFTGNGDNVVGKASFGDGRIWINATQYFDCVPAESWDLFIGGYRPARKWLKDRKDRELSYEDVQHYRRIIKILSETDRITRTISMSLGDSLYDA